MSSARSFLEHPAASFLMSIHNSGKIILVKSTLNDSAKICSGFVCCMTHLRCCKQKMKIDLYTLPRHLSSGNFCLVLFPDFLIFFGKVAESPKDLRKTKSELRS